MAAEVLLRAVHQRTLVLAGLAAVDCVPLPSKGVFADTYLGQ